jgi:AAA family ATP:ADP antiporter
VTSQEQAAARAIRLATVVSALLIAFQVSSRATRDALFLSNFPVTRLPSMMAGAAVLSLIAALQMARVMSRVGPGRLVPLMFGANATLLLAEWGLLGVAPKLASVLVFLQFNSFGALLVSSFWSLINERFDPRTAKRAIGQIGTAGTIGGVLGGLAAERVGAVLSVGAMLPMLAAIHTVCAALVLQIRHTPVREGPRPSMAVPKPAGFKALANSPYLRLLAAVVILVTISEGLLDYVFKATAKGAYGRGDTLLRFFAIFYTAVNVLAGLVGWLVGKRSVERLGLAKTVGVLHWSVALGGTGAIVVPGLASAVLARAAESVMHMTLFRAGYELLFTPLPPQEKRAAKPLLDVGAVRAGDLLAAGCVQAALLVWPVRSSSLMLGLAVVSAAVGIMLTYSIYTQYVAALERSLIARADELGMKGERERTTRLTMAHTMVGFNGVQVPEEPSAAGGAVPYLGDDADLERLAALHAPDQVAVREALRQAPLGALHVAQAIRLLGDDHLTNAAGEALGAVAGRHTGQLVDALLDPRTDFAVRRRLPAVIARARSARAMDGLLTGLHDQRFEVRLRCGRALAKLSADTPQVPVEVARVHAAVLNEVAIDHAVWEGDQLMEEDQDDPLGVGAAVRERASRSLEHVFTILALILPRQPLQVAFLGLTTDDPQLRGTALEYLETALPEEIREKLWPFIGDAPKHERVSRSKQEVVQDLLAARSSVFIDMEALKKKMGAP